MIGLEKSIAELKLKYIDHQSDSSSLKGNNFVQIE